jgi:hypothetical protein
MHLKVKSIEQVQTQQQGYGLRAKGRFGLPVVRFRALFCLAGACSV